MIWVLVAIAAVAVLPFFLEKLRRPMNKRLRGMAEGRFVRLPQGVTHYRWFGPAEGPVVVCVHGLTTPSFVWESVAARLVSGGYRVLVYDLYGRGYSDRPKGAQDADFFVRQLSDLLASQDVTEPFDLVGYSMGAAIATAYAARNPQRVRRLGLIAPAGMGVHMGPVARFVCRTPVIGDWIFLMSYPTQLRNGANRERRLPMTVQDLTDRLLFQISTQGYLPAILASLRGILSAPQEADHRTVAEAGVPVLAIWGQADAIIPLARKATFEGWQPQAQTAVIANAGHSLIYTHAERVCGLLLPFLKGEGETA
jgi:pimeloyl-ACP methyl ester carboxylesterase